MNKLKGKESQELEEEVYNSLLDLAKGLEIVDLDFLIDHTKNVLRKEAFMAAAEFISGMKPVLDSLVARKLH